MFGHIEPVNHCCFSPDDAFVSTSSNDGSVKVTAIKLDTYMIHVSWVHYDIHANMRIYIY